MELGLEPDYRVVNTEEDIYVSILVLMELGLEHLKRPFYDGKRDMFLSLF